MTLLFSHKHILMCTWQTGGDLSECACRLCICMHKCTFLTTYLRERLSTCAVNEFNFEHVYIHTYTITYLCSHIV